MVTHFSEEGQVNEFTERLGGSAGLIGCESKPYNDLALIKIIMICSGYRKLEGLYQCGVR